MESKYNSVEMGQGRLVGHCGANPVTLDEIGNVITPPATNTHTPIDHAFFIETILGAVQQEGMQVVDQAHMLARDGGNYFGMIELLHEQTDYGLVLGLRNSHNMSWAAGIVVGSRVFVCDNLSFSGEIKVMRKHTKNIRSDLPRLAFTAMAKLGEHRAAQIRRVEAYKETPVTDIGASHFMIEMVRGKVLPVQLVPKIIKEWHDPAHAEFAEHKNVWRFHNAVTEAAKARPVHLLPKMTMAMQGMLDLHVGIAA